jgi:hypothetical protein
MKDFNTALKELQAIFAQDKEKGEEDCRSITCTTTMDVEIHVQPGSDDKPGTYHVHLHPFPNKEDDGDIDAYDETGLTSEAIIDSLPIDANDQIWKISKP